MGEDEGRGFSLADFSKDLAWTRLPLQQNVQEVQ